MYFSDHPEVAIVLIVVVAVIVIWAIVRGRGLKFGYGKVTVDLAAAPQAPPQIKVASGLEADGGKIGNISGLKANSNSALHPLEEVTVLDQARLKNVEIGDITGVDLSPKAAPSEPKQ